MHYSDICDPTHSLAINCYSFPVHSSVDFAAVVVVVAVAEERLGVTFPLCAAPNAILLRTPLDD